MPRGVYVKTKAHGQHISKGLREYAKNSSKRCHKQRSKGGRASQKTLRKYKLGVYNPETGRKGGKSTVEKHGGWSGYHKVFKEKHPKEYAENLSNAGKVGGSISGCRIRTEIECLNISKSLKEYAKNNPEKSHERAIKAGKMGGPASIKSQREKAPYYFMSVPFASEQERQRAIMHLLSLGIVPIEGENCHVIVGNYEFDFRLFGWLFIEHHPWDRNGLSGKKYYSVRRRILDANGYKDCELIVIKSTKDVAEILNLLDIIC